MSFSLTFKQLKISGNMLVIFDSRCILTGWEPDLDKRSVFKMSYLLKCS